MGVGFFYTEQASLAQLRNADIAEKLTQVEGSLQLEGPALVSAFGPTTLGSDHNFAGFVIIEKSSFLNTASLAENTRPLRNGLLQYRIKDGDSLSTIAARYGISVNTIIWANDIEDTGLIQPGQEIIILPVSGVLHKIREQETLNSIATMYDVELGEIKTFNDNVSLVGDVVIVPHAKPQKTSTVYRGSHLPLITGYFSRPIDSGWNWGHLHERNAVDFSDACGTPILAAADGVVISTGSPSRWSGGYGGYIQLEHANNTKTFYAHNSLNLVSIGDIVSQGDIIAKIGNTGRVHGSAGCHVHFGVTGAQNPFAR